MFKTIALQKTLAVLFGGLSLLCALAIYAVPNLFLALVGFLIHSSIPLQVKPFDPIGIILGAAIWAVIGWAGGWAIGKVYVVFGGQ